jgi:three-Cys-motif partner protein
MALRFDRIGYWSELKLEIVRKYATAYSQILTAQVTPRLHHVYIDAFAGAGSHVSRTTGMMVAGSPLNALYINPPFREYHLIDLDPEKADYLQALIGDRPDVHVYEGDCNEILLQRVFPQVRYEDFRRGLCLLDPYGLHLRWSVIATAGGMRSLEIMLNFPVADINRNVLWRNPEGVDPADLARMTAFWGDESWRQIVYSTQGNLFGFEEKTADNERVAEAFRERLRTIAGFSFVPEPLPMRNSKGIIVYYLFFASHNRTGSAIIQEIVARYRDRGGRHG